MRITSEWLRSAVLVVLALGVGMLMTGCEDNFERAARMSCLWNHDINLKGCDRWDFARCIDHCEYCVGAPGSQFEGTSDECNQLKCGAYCAKQESDPKCLSTYKFLCEQGKEAFKKHHQATCNVDCNSTQRAQPQLLAMLAVALLAFSKFPTRLLIATCVLMIAFHIQGCGDASRSNHHRREQTTVSSSSSGGSTCAPQSPLMPDWKPDLEWLDKKAGCNNNWNWWSGNPCASDVPVILAKKGIYETDMDHIIEQVEVEKYNCTKVKDGYCAQWTNFEKSCKEEDFGVCTCTQPSSNKQYCHAWNCITKEANQNICWESCCGSESCSPCVLCGEWGSAPFPMNRQVFDELLAREGVISNMSKVEDTEKRNSSTLYLRDLDVVEPILGRFRHAYWSNFWYGGVCIVGRDVHSPYEVPCSRWREIETEVQTCECIRPDSSQNYCEDWKCEEKDVGQFSILFSAQISYEDLIVGQERETYKCQSEQTTQDGAKKCNGWRGEIESREEVEVTQCRGCEDTKTPHCQSWYCDEYEVPKILHEELVWPRRLGYAFLHLMWIWAALFTFWGTCTVACMEEGGTPASLVTGLCGSTCVAFLFWLLAFVRYRGAEQYWYSPYVPLLGLALTIGASCLVFGVSILGLDSGKTHSMCLLLSWLSIVTFGGLAWVGGMSMVLALVVPFGCCILLCFGLHGGPITKRSRGVLLDAGEDGEVDEEVDEEDLE